MRTYNPLSVDELGRNAARALMSYPPDRLPPETAFRGAGVYTIHYNGPFPAYTDLSDQEPIYVGKADPPGKRQGRRTAVAASNTLYARLAGHADSINAAYNLNLDDFRCRWLILDPVWIGLTEQILVSQYQPIWNVTVSGFGNNDPGRGRWNQRRSQWDTLHPGRAWAANLQESNQSQEQILSLLKGEQ